MMLKDLITALEAADPNQTVRHGFANPHSYRGYYMDLAFEPAANVTVAAMLADARSALGATYQGYKGGDFTMDAYTDCWLSLEGEASGDSLGSLLLQLMLADPGTPREPQPAVVDGGQWATIRGLVDWLDEANGRTDEEITLRILKLAEETGEVGQAWIGVRGQNPRKGVTHTREDVADELCDVIVTAAVALASMLGDPAARLNAKLAKIAARSGVNV
ncbi:MazG-like family protein [Streptomyces mirabilis]|uniref:MazG-like family protein n=1 Tax=Streptomyces mirabilis TaxID=68239 RepID=UPI0033DD4E2B